MAFHLSYLVCPSGLGHLSRTLAVVNYLSGMMPDISITLHLETWQTAYAEKRINHSQVCIAQVGVPFVFTPQGRTAWTSAALAGVKYDFLVSDNLMEAILFQEDIALVGSFLWGSDGKNFRENPLWIKTDKMRIPIFGNETFAMPSVRGLSGFNPVGLMGKCENHESSGDHILFSFGRSYAAKELCLQARDVICPDGKPLEGIVFDDVEGSKPVGDYSSTFFSRFGSAVIRPGIGTVSDCLRYGVPIVVFHESGNDEMEWNTKILLDKGLARTARTADEALKEAHAWNDRVRRSEFHRMRQSLRWSGEKDIAAGILNCLEELK